MSSVQDFLTVCCPEMGSNPKTLGVLPSTTVHELAEQCAARFEQGSYYCLIIFTFFFFTIKLHDKLRLVNYSITVTGIENAPKQSIENNFQKNANCE